MQFFDIWMNLLGFLDLTSGDKPSFSKLVLVVILIACVIQQKLSLGIVVALLSASFGKSMFIAFLSRSNFVDTEETKTNVTISKVIQDRRDGDIEPAI